MVTFAWLYSYVIMPPPRSGRGIAALGPPLRSDPRAAIPRPSGAVKPMVPRSGVA
jgi:hypothetical protein